MFISGHIKGALTLKILVISQYFWPENFRINDLASELHKKGHSVTVLTGKPNYPQGKIFPGYGFFKKSIDNFKGIEVKRVPLIPRGTDNRLQLILNYLSFVLFSCLLIPFRFRDEYDVIFVYEPSPISVCLPAILVKKIKKIPIVFWVQDLWPESLSATGAVKSVCVLKIINLLVKYIYKSCDLILVQSKAFISSIEKFGVNSDVIHYFPNSAEKLYKPINMHDAREFDMEMPKGFRIVFAGNIGAAQSMQTIIQAAVLLNNNPSIHWIIIGSGRRQEWLEKEINLKGLQSNVHLLGQKSIEKMPYYFSASDVLLATLNPEPIFSLTIPGKIQSYMACRKPIITAIDGEAARIIEESGSGIAVSAGNASELSDAVVKLYEMSEENRAKMGEKGREYFERHFESSRLVSQLESWLMDLSR